MEPFVVEPGGVFDDRELELAAADAILDQLGLEAVDEALGERVVVGVADRADRRLHAVAVEGLAVVIREILVDSSGRRNTLIREVLDGTGAWLGIEGGGASADAFAGASAGVAS